MEVKIGQHVTYHDSQGRPRPAIVTNKFGVDNPSINVVVVALEPEQTDNYGQKIERYTSVPHRTHQQAHGNYWVA